MAQNKHSQGQKKRFLITTAKLLINCLQRSKIFRNLNFFRQLSRQKTVDEIQRVRRQRPGPADGGRRAGLHEVLVGHSRI